MHRIFPCKLSSRHPLLQFGMPHTGAAPSASALLKLSAPWNGDPVPVCHGTRHRKDFNICHGRLQLLPGRGSSSAHKGCLCRAWSDGRAKLLHVMCLGNWEMAEISGSWHILLSAGTRSQSDTLFLPSIPVSSLPAHSTFCLGLMALYFILLFIKKNVGLCSLRISWNVVKVFLINQTLVPSWASLEGTASCKFCPCKGHKPVISGCQEAPESLLAARCAENVSWEM